MRWRSVCAVAISDKVSFSNARMWLMSGAFHLGSALLADWRLPAPARWTPLEATSEFIFLPRVLFSSLKHSCWASSPLESDPQNPLCRCQLNARFLPHSGSLPNACWLCSKSVLQSGVAPWGRDALRMRSDFILLDKQGREKKFTEDRFTLKWWTNPTSAITSLLTQFQSSLHGSMWADVLVRACASDSPPADVAA